ncbi:hypothetical protein IEQ34_020974 [Dendrobium chrysotoxum]|uniref:Uncharacterized protein n=1 Tax=Dendrobium chrysotoxum TaxID=161865 RepID=A0AAV7G277_DENCH|nr:hypothetical protein IEQ34_020974 [Dendrobium chrysotoxum]
MYNQTTAAERQQQAADFSRVVNYQCYSTRNCSYVFASPVVEGCSFLQGKGNECRKNEKEHIKGSGKTSFQFFISYCTTIVSIHRFEHFLQTPNFFFRQIFCNDLVRALNCFILVNTVMSIGLSDASPSTLIHG